MTFAKISDGASKTMLASEKWVYVGKYTDAGVGDNIGWASGWDVDTLRSTLIRPRQDSLDPQLADGAPYDDPSDYAFGSAHAGGINAVFGDGSVALISYDVDLEHLNCLGHRSDGEVTVEDH